MTKRGIKKTESIFVTWARPKQRPAISKFFHEGLLVNLQNVYIERKINNAPPISAVTMLPNANRLGEKAARVNAKRPDIVPYNSCAHLKTKKAKRIIKIKGTIRG